MNRNQRILYDIPMSMTTGRSRRVRRLGRRGSTNRLRLGLWRCGGSHWGPTTEIWNARRAKQRLGVDRDLKTLYDIPIVMTSGRSRRVRRLGQRGPTIRLRLGFRRGGGSHRGPVRSMKRKWSPNSAIPAKQTLLNLLFISTQTIAPGSEKHVRHN
jgi:hypothetical protein